MRRLNPFGNLLGYFLTFLLFIGIGLSLLSNRGLAFSPGELSAKGIEEVIIKGFSSHANFEKQCNTCHEPVTSTLATKCLDCHTDVEQQIANTNGAHSQIADNHECASCHPDHRGRNFDLTSAAYQLFDHSVTNFSLNLHQINFDATPMTCSACHKDSSYSVVDNQPCESCHSNHEQAFDKVHIVNYGTNCLGCHDGVDSMLVFDHTQTLFALSGQHAELKCVDCHTDGNSQKAPTTCQDCHAESEAHLGEFEATCEICHNQQSWTPANLNGSDFEHFVNTGFSLTLHATDYSNQVISCRNCHPTELKILEKQACLDCHTNHNAVFMTQHQLQYGNDCMVCHDGVDRLRNFDHNNFFILDGKHASIQCEACHANQIYRSTPNECYQCHLEPEIHRGVFGQKCAYCHNSDAWSPANLRKHEFPINHGLDNPGVQLGCTACHGSNYFEYTCYSCHDHQTDEIVKIHTDEGVSTQDLTACASCHPTGVIGQND